MVETSVTVQWLGSDDARIAQLWRFLQELSSGSWTFEGRSEALTESAFVLAIQTHSVEFVGGRVVSFSLDAPTWTASGVIVTERKEGLPIVVGSQLEIQPKAGWEEEEVRQMVSRCRDVFEDCLWIGAEAVGVCLSGPTVQGRPMVGWVNYISLAEYNVAPLSAHFADSDVAVEMDAKGATVWVSGPRWSPDNYRAVDALSSMEACWEECLATTHTLEATYEHLAKSECS